MSVRYPFAAVAFASCVASGSASAQSTFTDFAISRLSIRQSLKDKNTINEPAVAYFTFPRDGEDTREVAAAVTFNLAPASPTFDGGIALQYNENTSTDARQNLLVVGTDFGWLTSYGPVERPTWFSDLRIVAGFRRDGERHTKGVTANAYWTASAPRTVCRYCPQLDIARVVNWMPQVGAEYDNAISAALDADEGAVARAMVRLVANVFPLGRTPIGKRLIATADVSYRRDVWTEFEGSDRNHPYSELSLSYAFDPHNIVLVSVDRVSGENPSEAFEDQTFVRVALKVQFDRPQKASIEAARAKAP